ncbi:MAG: hypothetical protein CMH32_05610 [Micavibrio sp.]|nr:hypothetical protein [Micavibrio sp.]HCK32764.1 hypothetical protein [Rhodospirillaceae bacterium]
MKFLGLILCLFVPLSVYAHENHDEEAQPIYQMIPAAIEQARAKITKDGAYLKITSNGIPNHQTGQFPNSDNPNAIQAQNHEYRVAASPHKAGRVTQMRGQPFGVAINGIPFDPGTAECYGQQRGGRPGNMAVCEWREEAIVNGRGQLGLDSSNAHVQPDGTYHYHGIPNGLVLSVPSNNDLIMVGYAADGFGVYVSKSARFKPSYQLKPGTRPSGPGGHYSGKYTQDYTYIAQSGDLDECNGYSDASGNYAYILTKDFPFIPRCWVGTPDESFERQPLNSGGRQSREGRRPPPPRHRY